MLGRLIQGYGKSSSSSSRPQRKHTVARYYGLSTSPSFRIGPFDDRGGVGVAEAHNLRVVIAQDAFGSLDKQLVLYDSHKTTSDASPRKATAPTATLRDGNKSRTQQPMPMHQRNRSSTIGGPASAWTRHTRDTDGDDKVNRLLECMFGNTSTTKSDASTKMHILLSGSDAAPAQLSTASTATTRPNFPRALTSQTTTKLARANQGSWEDATSDQDVILITRLFAVPLPDSKEPIVTRPRSGEQTAEIASPMSEDGGASRKTKLIEKKTPMYAVGLLVTLPREESRSNFSRPPSRMSVASTSFPSSSGSDFASSWSLLEAISDSLSSPTRTSPRQLDNRISVLTNSWDMILRAMSDVEAVAKEEIRHGLQLVNRQVMSSTTKVPKGLNEQRTNQRNIYITQPMALAGAKSLHTSSRHLVQRLTLGLQIPRVITGIGFRDGHWNDEARYLVHVCNSKSQNHFLLNLLTAFLGNHTEWLGSALTKAAAKEQDDDEAVHEPSLGLSRTVIVCDQRALARRYIFMLASFLPSLSGISPFEQRPTPFKSPLPTPGLSSSSLKHVRYASDQHNDTRGSSHSHHVTFGDAHDATLLSTSVSSRTSASTHASMRPSKALLTRKDSDTTSMRTASRFSAATSATHMRKTSAASSALTPQPVATQPYLPSSQDSYFPADAVADSPEYGATNQLAQILRRDSSSTVAPRSSNGSWGFLGLWSRKGSPTVAGEDASNASPAVFGNLHGGSSMRGGSNKLESMVSEATSAALPQSISQPRKPALPADDAHDLVDERLNVVEAPRLRVDEEDGVVDVDIGLPGFLDWDADAIPVSPGSRNHASASGRSLEGIPSLRSSFSQPSSYAAQSTAGDAGVAGWLRRYHEDFRLQAVKPYSDLVSDIRDSMLRESRSLLSRDAANMSDTSDQAETWVDISSTLMVDARRYTVERLTLQRKLGRSRIADLQSPTPPTDSRTAVEHRFVMEPVNEPDPMLADAFASILDLSRKSHSRSASGTAKSGPATPAGSLPREITVPPRILRSSCQQAVAEVLEQVVKSVSEHMDNHDEGRAVSTKASAGQSAKERQGEEHNVLREGVKRWLLAAEPRSVW
ncbi:uncharacterized protein AB675_1694 [Cyphellophora attinorum]|uniref:Folliculin-interacting protein N-terminal domain-containing protein n=1 Tax=Cyphellophora attinorum TaxID=1664694 RepID=A0A0N1HIS6_9EURO|nr:uncharacterized protein AB675_1694 [Phialophora attinorum]KPI36085.1 hypothetical protein AB675_1694 [Phialophora attinorum]